MIKRIFQISVLMLVIISTETTGQPKREQVILAARDLWSLVHPSNDFYGLFASKQLFDNFFDFEVRKINIRDYCTAAETMDYERVKKDKLLYVFLGFDSLSTNIRGWKFESDYLLPGQTLSADKYHIYAKGEIIETKDPASMEVFDAIDNYRVGVKIKVQGKIIDQSITKGYQLTRWNVGNYLGGIKVDWVGDLNGDGRPEIIMTECGHHECFDIVLYSPDRNFNIKEVYRGTVCGG